MEYENFTKLGLILCTYSYNYIDVVIILNVLIIKYKLSCRLINSNGKPTILIPAKCLGCLRKIIITYLITGIFNKISQIVSNASNNNLNLKHFKEQGGGGVNQQGVMSIQTIDNNTNNIDFNENINKLNNISFDRNILNRYNKKFLEWFIGFSEGDDSFVISKGSKIYIIYLHIVNLPLLYEIKAQLNMVNIYSNAKSAYLFIKSKDEIKTLIVIFNGNLVLQKCKLQFDKWALNFKSKYNLNFNIKSNKINPTLTDSWLAGLFKLKDHLLLHLVKPKLINNLRGGGGQKDTELEFIYK
uniref:Homing endonuclease LAGLIDADG domain-containing protein n=1 Tax=Orbilia brochopaga TaxID=3140254 RepID=A0A4Y5MV43_9PEZI|nr:hypothetical protein [Drechslerella brochopaga]